MFPINHDEGYVYLLYSENGLYKIGRSKEIPANRYGAIAKQSPVRINLIHYFKCTNAKQGEAVLHKKFNSKRVLGEWFDLIPKEVAAICSLGEDKP